MLDPPGGPDETGVANGIFGVFEVPSPDICVGNTRKECGVPNNRDIETGRTLLNSSTQCTGRICMGAPGAAGGISYTGLTSK